MKLPKYTLKKFQFLMVRLKVSDEAYSEKITGISIPYGAIKRLVSIIALLIAIIFQFLMVRLKDYKIFFDAVFRHISIPYGAIKSYQCFRLFHNFFISIPYGAIKRIRF